MREPRILLVEDDAHLAAGLRYNLERAGYAVSHAATGPDGLARALEEDPDLVILDLMLPGLGGYDVLERLRPHSRVPVIILSVQDQEVDKIRGFDAGADDYVSKPFAVGELLARIRARLRDRDEPRDENTFLLGDGVVRLDAHRFERSGASVPLTPTEVEILRILLSSPGIPVARERLLREVWGTRGSRTRTLDTHVTRLRKKLEADASRPAHLVTVHGVGYRLDA